jgi:hypothetical protein
MSADTIRLIFTYAIAVLVLVGAFILLVLPSQVGSETIVPFVTGIVGIVLGFVFNRESTTAGARQSERAVAQGAAQATGSTTVNSASTTVEGGNPTNVITERYWMNNPEFAEIREKARAELAPLAATAAFYAWVEAIRLLREHKLDPHDVIFLAGLSVDKSQLLSGAATMRTETRALSDSLDDHERQVLRDLIDGAVAEAAEAVAGGVEVGAGAEVRE